MALLGNHSAQNRTSLRQFTGGVSTTIQSGYLDTYTPWGTQKNRYYGGYAKYSSTPNGYSHPMAWVMPKQSGGLVARRLTGTVSTTNGNLVLGIGISAALDAAISTTNGTLALIVALEAALSASGTLTNAQLAIILQLQASLTATGTITNADMGNILNLVAALQATGAFTNVQIVNLINLSANITSATELSPESLAASVWNASAGDFNTAGTMGEKLNDAGAAGNPWAALTVDNNTAGTFGAFVQKLLTIAKFLGLK